jgi:uncharacterized protein YukJ
MPLKHYSLLIGTYDRGLMAPDANHYEIKLNNGSEFFRIAVNVRSQDGSMLMSHIDYNYQHEICARLLEAYPQNGIYDINEGSKRKQFGLDFLRRNMVGDFNKLIELPNQQNGLDNDLEEKLSQALEQTKSDPGSRIFAFGERWPGTDKPDRYFPEIKDQGIHDIHMNQGNPPGRFDKDNGVFQDGGLLIYYPSLGRWTAILLAFQTQFNTLRPTTLHTDDVTGHRIGGTGPEPRPIDGEVLIIAALVNPRGSEKGKEKVYLLNTSEQDIALKGWKLVDRNRQEYTFGEQVIGAASTLTLAIPASSNFTLGNSGGTITLLNKAGLKISGVQYTKEQASAEGKVIKL